MLGNSLRVLCKLLAVGCIVGCIGGCIVACNGPEENPRPSSRPNVLLVVIDSLRADHLKSYGYARETSPSLDRLAREGARFATALAPTSWALPSLVTLLTALPPEQHGVVRADLALNDTALTLAEVLAKAGFTTSAIVAGADSEASRGLSQGFERYTEVAGDGFVAGRVESEVDSFLTRWDRAGRKDPFFLFVQMPLVVGDDVLPRSARERFVSHDPKATEVQRAMDRYDRGIHFADSQLDLILQNLDALELTRTTLVIVTASHGFEFFERGNVGSGHTLHRESVRVPLIVRYPRQVDAGRVIDQPARLMDIGATIMMLTRTLEPAEFGFHHPAHAFANRDLSEFLVGEWNGKEVVTGGDLAGKSQSIRQGDYKLIKHRDHTLELFNLKLDPLEQHDLSEVEVRRTAVYSKKLEDWRSACAARPQYAKPHRPTEG